MDGGLQLAFVLVLVRVTAISPRRRPFLDFVVFSPRPVGSCVLLGLYLCGHKGCIWGEVCTQLVGMTSMMGPASVC